MRIEFNYKCRRCSTFLADPSNPETEAVDEEQADAILRHSVERNPQAITLVPAVVTHLCLARTVGVCDLVGFRILPEPETSEPKSKKKLKLVDDQKSRRAKS
jgi:hypothetical protein